MPEAHVLILGTDLLNFEWHAQVFALNGSGYSRADLYDTSGNVLWQEGMHGSGSDFRPRGYAVVNGIMYTFGNDDELTIARLDGCTFHEISATLSTSMLPLYDDQTLSALAYDNGSQGFNLILFLFISFCSSYLLRRSALPELRCFRRYYRDSLAF